MRFVGTMFRPHEVEFFLHVDGLSLDWRFLRSEANFRFTGESGVAVGGVLAFAFDQTHAPASSLFSRP